MNNIALWQWSFGRYGLEFTETVLMTLAFEGVDTNHPSDRGGKTRYGITRLTLARYNGFTRSNLFLDEITIRDAVDIYHELFWLFPKIGTLSSASSFMFDWHVNSGTFAIRSMQRWLKVKPDGIIGPVTAKKIDDLIRVHGSDFVIRALAIRRMRLLCRLVRRDPTQAAFIEGWWNRVSTFLE